MKKYKKALSLGMISLFIAGQASAASEPSRLEYDKNLSKGNDISVVKPVGIEPSDDPIPLDELMPLSKATTFAAVPSYRVGHDMEREIDNDWFSDVRYTDAMLLRLDANNQFSLYGSLNDYDYKDYLKIQVPKPGDYSFYLQDTTDDTKLDLRLYIKDASGTTIDSTTASRLNVYLDSYTTYYIYVEWRDSANTYNTTPYAVDITLN